MHAPSSASWRTAPVRARALVLTGQHRSGSITRWSVASLLPTRARCASDHLAPSQVQSPPGACRPVPPTAVFSVTAPFFVSGSPHSCRALPPRVAQIAVIPVAVPRGQWVRAHRRHLRSRRAWDGCTRDWHRRTGWARHGSCRRPLTAHRFLGVLADTRLTWSTDARRHYCPQAGHSVRHTATLCACRAHPTDGAPPCALLDALAHTALTPGERGRGAWQPGMDSRPC